MVESKLSISPTTPNTPISPDVCSATRHGQNVGNQTAKPLVSQGRVGRANTANQPPHNPSAAKQHLRRNISLDGLLTIEELAEKLKVKPRTVRDWVQRRRIGFTRFLHRIYFSPGVVEDVLRRNVVAPISPSPTLAEQGGAQTDREAQT